MNRFSDFAAVEGNLPGRKVSMNDLLGHEIALWAFRIMPSSKMEGRDYMQFQFDLDGEQCVAFTGSNVLMSQMRTYQDKLPFTATIQKRGKYFTFT